MALLAVQGPEAAEILQPLTTTDLSSIKYYHFAEGEVAGMPMIISRTGYTGEDGFELYHDVQYAVRLWKALMAAGDVTPAGLGAATRCVSRWAWRSTATTSTTPSRRSRRTSPGWSSSRRATSWDATRSSTQKAQRRAEEARGLHDGRPQLPAPRLSGVRERRAERHGVQRHDEPDARHSDRHRATCRRNRRRKARPSRSRSAASACRRPW